eukprot:SM000187S03865  [mRNA]  locus=s187:38786:47393:+ [translate_table: standard]
MVHQPRPPAGIDSRLPPPPGPPPPSFLSPPPYPATQILPSRPFFNGPPPSSAAAPGAARPGFGRPPPSSNAGYPAAPPPFHSGAPSYPRPFFAPPGTAPSPSPLGPPPGAGPPSAPRAGPLPHPLPLGLGASAGMPAMSPLPIPKRPAETVKEDQRAQARDEEAASWTAHKSGDGILYFYNTLTNKSTYERPPGFTGEVEKVSSQPTPVAWERIPQSDWALVTTDDKKKYYYNTKSQATSWQVPEEVADTRRRLAEEEAKAGKEPGAFALSTPAIGAGGREAVGHKASLGSPLSLVKKKLKDSGTPSPGAAPVSGILGPKPPEAGGPTMAPAIEILSAAQEEQGVKAENEEASDSDSSSDGESERAAKEKKTEDFKEMLKEKGVAPFSKWDRELPKIIFDPRFKASPIMPYAAIPTQAERRAIFDRYVKTRAEEERKERRAALKEATEGFRQLLEEVAAELDHSTTPETFAGRWGEDPRCEALDKEHRDPLIMERVAPMRKAEEERQRVLREEAAGAFKALLTERADITANSRWLKVKEGLRDEARYLAVAREDRESLFDAHVRKLRQAEQEAERAAKAKRDEEEKQREREREERKRKEREEAEAAREKAKARRKEALAAFRILLVEQVKDSEATWSESRSRLEKDERFAVLELEVPEREQAFREHVVELHKAQVAAFKELLTEKMDAESAKVEESKGRRVLSSWSAAKRLLKDDGRYLSLPRKDREALYPQTS